MRWLAVLGLVVGGLAGCDTVFGLSGGASADAGPDPRCLNPTVVQPVEITGDATLDGSSAIS